eukprot:1301977-Ditylum_brightwellii.AAC.1
MANIQCILTWQWLLGTNIPHKCVVDQDSMEQHLHCHHICNYQQAQGIPFTIAPLTNMFRDYTETDFSRRFRESLVDIDTIEGINDHTKMFLKELAPNPTNLPPVETNFTAQHVKEGFKVWRESTTTSPHGQHLVLHKAWLHAIPSDKILSSKKFYQIIADTINLAIKYVYPLHSWAQVHNIYLLKESGNYKIHCLHMIHMIHTILNIMRRKLVTRQTLQNAEEYHHLHTSQYGGRKGHSAINTPMSSTFILESMHLQQANNTFTDCNAKACYNRIITIITALTKYKAGLPTNACTLLAKALKQMEYSIVTAYGPSTITNKHSKESPLHGIGQGPTDAPPGWTFNVNICTKCYNKLVHGFKITDPTQTIRRTAAQFVDDNKLAHNGSKTNLSPASLMAITSHDITLWDTFLNIDGGLLELTKTAYTILVWTY